MLYLRQRLVQITGVQMTQLFESEKDHSLEEAEALYQAGLGLFQSGDMKGAEKCFVSAVRPFLSKNTMQNIYVKVEDFAPELLNSMYHMGLIYLQDNEKTYSDSYSKAAAIFQYCHKYREKYKIAEESEIGKVDFLKEAYLAEKKFLSSIGVNSDEDESEGVSSEGAYYRSKLEEYEGHKEELEELREKTEAMILSISGFTMESVGERAKSVEGIYKETTEFFVSPTGDGLVQRLLADCNEKLGLPPCEFAVVGLGSLAAGKMTPWSDLEFAIVTENDDYEDSKNPDPAVRVREQEYFRNLTKLLHIKITNFGETPLRSVGIESFNNFKTGEEGDDWFWDECITSGFSFDGPDWHACKTPLGRQGGKRVGEGAGYKVKKTIKDEATGREEEITLTKPDFELIMTPEQMAAFQKERDISKLINHRGETIITREELLASAGPESDGEVEPYMVDGYLTAMEEQKDGWFGSDGHLVQGLRSTSLIGGTAKAQDLLDQYRSKVREQDEQIGQEGLRRELIQKRSLELLAENVDDFKLKLGDEEEGKLLDIKKSIYRIADRVIAELANYYGIQPEPGEAALTSWQIIDRMESSDNPTGTPLLSKEGAQHLREALSIAAELRLATYSHNKGQLEGISTYVPAVEHLTEERKKELLEETFHLDSTKLLHHFYQVMLRVQKIAKAICEAAQTGNALQDKKSHVLVTLLTDHLLDTSDHTKGLIHARFLEYSQAIHCLERARKQNLEDLYLLQDLCFVYNKCGLVKESINLGEEWLHLEQSIHKTQPSHHDIAASYTNLGNAYSHKEEYDKALEVYLKALEINMSYYSSANYTIGGNYSNLGNVYSDQGEYSKAIEMYKKALEVFKIVYISTPHHKHIAACYNNLGVVYIRKNDYDAAIKMCNKALEIYREADITHASGDIAASHYNLGNLYDYKEDYREAIKEYQKAIAIYKVVYKSLPDQEVIARCYGHLGLVHIKNDNFDEAIEMCSKALEIYVVVYNTPHSELAASYDNIAEAYAGKGNYSIAAEMRLKALEMKKILYIDTPFHPDIAISYIGVGNVYRNIGEYDNSIKMYNEAIKIYKVASHPKIADGYMGLGNAYSDIGNHAKAIEMYLEALRVNNDVYTDIPNHPSIAMNYGNLSQCYFIIGNFRQALLYSQKSLNIFSSHSSEQRTELATEIHRILLWQMAVESLLQDNLLMAREYLIEIDRVLSEVDFSSPEFLALLVEQVGITYDNNSIQGCINAQKLIIKLDPNMQHGNHYHNLACYYASDGCMLRANENFKKALQQLEITDDLRVEYAHFLIVNIDQLITHSLEEADSICTTIKEYLYCVVQKKVQDDSSLIYGKIEKNNVCKVLRDMILQKSDAIVVYPKILAYYLLITRPEYIVDDKVDMDELLLSFQSTCDSIQDEVSFRLLSDAYISAGNEDLGNKCLRDAKLLEKLDKIANSSLSKEELAILVSDDLDNIMVSILKLKNTALILAKEQRIEDAVKSYHKIFTIYQRLISEEIIEQTLENIEHYKLATNNLATMSLLAEEITLFLELKQDMGAEINPALVAAAGANIEQISDFEQAIMTQLQAQSSEEQQPQVQTETLQSEEQEAGSTDTVAKLGETEDEFVEL